MDVLKERYRREVRDRLRSDFGISDNKAIEMVEDKDFVDFLEKEANGWLKVPTLHWAKKLYEKRYGKFGRFKVAQVIE